MKKILLVIVTFIILGTTIAIICNKKNIYTQVDGIKYAIVVDGQSTNSFPSGNYKANVDCTNAHGYWDSIQQKVIIKNITGNVSCYIGFESITNDDYLNNYIISLEGDLYQGNGMVVHEIVDAFTPANNQMSTITDAGYRYEGRNPNNYILFNNEIWRIIGVFGPESHDQTGKQLVKIIREESLGSFQWKNMNNWNTSNINTLLNGAYYNHSVDTTNCNVNTSTATSRTCDFTKIGIQNGYQEMIENVRWYLGGYGKTEYTTYTAPMEYQYERMEIAYNTSSYITNALGKIGLMYMSDFLYGAREQDCSRSVSGADYSNSNYSEVCPGKNWLYSGYSENTMNMDSSRSNSLLYIYHDGSATTTYSKASYGGFEIRPVLYLSSSVYKISGSGSLVDPYIIGLASND